MAAGLVMLMIGCSAQPVPEGDDLYREGEQRYLAMATTMHTVLMGMHEGDWSVSVGGYGADPESCDLAPSGEGYSFGYERELLLPRIDGPSFSEVAVAAFTEVGLEAKTAVYGEDGDRPEWNVIAEDGVVGRAVVTIRPGEDWVGVSLESPCFPGNADELAAMVTDEESRSDEDVVWRSMPAAEGVDSVPQFYFPAGGPVYFNEDRTPVEPQPVVTDPPKAPYGG